MTRKRAFIRFVPPLLAALLVATPSVAGQDEDEYDRGRTAVFEERWEDVREIFDEFPRRFPDSPHVDDAQYWLGMALYELGQEERAYGILKRLNTEHPDSPWLDDARVLMVRCAETLLKSASPGRGRFAGGGMGVPSRSGTRQRRLQLAEYEAFIEKSTQDSNSKVQILAIDTMLVSQPEKAPELLPRLNRSSRSRAAADLVLDRFFGRDRVKVTLEDPQLGLSEDNVDIMVRQRDKVAYLTLPEALELIRSPAGRTSTGKSFDKAIIAEIRDKILKTEQGLMVSGSLDPAAPVPHAGGERVSAIVKVIDGEVHYYRNGDETTRIVVLRRDAGFRPDNVRVFIETTDGIRQIGLEQARSLSLTDNRLGLEENTVRYLKAALAIIEIDLSDRAATSSD